METDKKGSFLTSDPILYLRLKKYKDQQAFLEAYDLYVKDIYRFVYFKINNKEDAEDLTSAIFLKCWNYVVDGKLKEHKTLKALLYTIARNVIIDHYRSTNLANSLTKQIDDIDAIDVIDEKTDLAQGLDNQMQLTALQEKLPLLKDEYREVIILKFINELTIKEIGEILGKSKGSVRVLLHRALKALKELIS